MSYFGNELIVETEFDEVEDLVRRLAKWTKNNPAYGTHGKKHSGRKSLSEIVRTGAAHVHGTISSYVPVDTGALKAGLILHREKYRFFGKVIYDIMPDPAKNSIFRKPIENRVRCSMPYGYYPASQEYGFFTRRADGGMTYTRSDGDEMNLDKVPGKFYMRTGVEVSEETVRNTIAGQILDDILKDFGD